VFHWSFKFGDEVRRELTSFQGPTSKETNTFHGSRHNNSASQGRHDISVNRSEIGLPLASKIPFQPHRVSPHMKPDWRIDLSRGSSRRHGSVSK
jgi:hypothetical protein